MTSIWGWIFWLLGVAFVVAIFVTGIKWLVLIALLLLLIAAPFEKDYPSGF